MVKLFFPVLLFFMAVLSSCSSLKPVQSGNSHVAAPVHASTSHSNISSGNDIKFLDDISMTSRSIPENMTLGSKKKEPALPASNRSVTTTTRPGLTSVEKASALQLKYAVLLNTDVELLGNTTLLEHVDEWYGTRYRMGGTSKSGIDCSAFVQAVYLSAFAVSLPRTAREQFRTSRIISATELKEGDLVFFNTTGGISHVGIYLLNNKFIHASSSQGVTVSDLFDPYYLKRYIGAGRIEKPEVKAK